MVNCKGSILCTAIDLGIKWKHKHVCPRTWNLPHTSGLRPLPIANWMLSLSSSGLGGAFSRYRHNSPMYCTAVHRYFNISAVKARTENLRLCTYTRCESYILVLSVAVICDPISLHKTGSCEHIYMQYMPT